MSTIGPSSPTPPSPSGRPVTPLALANAQGNGPGNLLMKVLLAAAIVIAAIGAYFYFGRTVPVATGEVTHLTAYPIHRVSTSALDATPAAAKVEQNFDEIIILAQVRLRNQSHGPLFLSDMASLLSLPGEEQRSLAATATYFDRAFIAYPELQPMKQQPLLRDITILAGQTVEGQLIFNYPITKDQWNLRRSLDISISFLHQNDLIMPAPQ